MRATVGRAPDQPVVGAGPDQPVPHLATYRCRRPRRAADPCSRVSFAVGGSSVGGTPGRARVRSGLIGVQVWPPSLVRKMPLVAEIKRVIALPHVSGSVHSPRYSPGKASVGSTLARLARLEVEPVDPAAVDDIRIVGVGRDFVAFTAGGDLMEIASC